ncbi:MAG: HEPN domain-containing protein [Candidatus Omnitrophica bacterium]|nr:HEPN domain-containing protein [Candidatus Omnitrophota bacterium]
MKIERAALARFRFKRARETFQEGVLLLGGGAPNGAANRFYYAAFYASRALLATQGLDASKHSGVISLFGQHFVKRGTINAQVAKALRRSFEKRLDTDYEDFAWVDAGEVEQIKHDVQRFIDECERVLIKLVGSATGCARPRSPKSSPRSSARRRR